MTVFIIDDNEMTRTVLRMIILGNGYDVLGEASTAAAGLSRVMQPRPDIVCVDILMPDRSGLELLDIVQTHLPGLVVLMVTARNDIGTVTTSLARGAQGFIVKPFNGGTVLDTLDAACARLKPGWQRGSHAWRQQY